MKTKIKTLSDALTFLLQGLYFAENALTKEFASCCGAVSSPKIRKTIQSYIASCYDKKLKIERISNYLMKEPLSRNNEVITSMIKETQTMLSSSNSEALRDVLSIACLQNINTYKISGYRSAHMMAAELELDAVTNLVQQILDWELETQRDLSVLLSEEFNKNQGTMKLKNQAWEIE